jgi:Icc-related predicted phosphoesterase
MKVLYSSDLHGEIRLYEELLEWVHTFKSEIVALGGDLFPSFAPSRRYEDMIPNQQRFTDQFLRPFFRKMVDTMAVQRIFLIPGNWDLAYPLLFTKPMERVVDLDRQAYRLENGYEWVGYPFVPPTPFRPKDYEKRDDADAPSSQNRLRPVPG